MPFNKTQMRSLCTAAEFSLALKSLAPDIGRLSPADLVKNIKRTRALRDKNRDLYKRQTRSAGKGTGLNERTAEKAQAFDQVLKAFEDRLAQLKNAATASAKKPAKTKQSAKARLAAKTSRKKARAAKVKAKKKPSLTSKKTLAASEKGSPATPLRWGGFSSKAAQDAGNRAQLQQSRSKPILSHVKSAGKRSQAKRDSR